MFQLNNMTSSKIRECKNHLTWNFKGLDNEIFESDLSTFMQHGVNYFCLAPYRPL